MQNPFPGMNPYLEDIALWGEVHHRMITYLADALNRVLPEPYAAFIEERVYVESPAIERQMIPDVLVSKPLSEPSRAGATAALADAPTRIQLETLDPHREGYIQIFSLRDRQRVLTTVIEILSPTNKTPNAVGREQYLKKQQELLQSTVHLMEIDLLHYGEHTVFLPREAIEADGSWDYLIALHRAGWGGRAGDVWRVALPEKLPRVVVPLLPADGEVVVDLQEVLNQTYEAGQFHRKIDYSVDPLAPLSPDKLAWVRQWLQQAGLRSA